MACVTFFILAVLVVLRKLIDCVVCQMHIGVVYVATIGFLIGFGTESSEGHLVQVDAQGTYSVQKNVDAQIILQPIYKMWPINVLLHHVAGFVCIQVKSVLFRYCLLKDVVHILGEENSLALTQTIRLANVGRPLA